MKYNLERFEAAHRQHFSKALQEVGNGRKVSHWMWYIFPQLKGLGWSETSRFYSLADMEEARSFLTHAQLGKNIISISQSLLALPANNATAIFGTPDDMKLHSSMTLFSLIPDADPVFKKVLDKYFNGKPDRQTVLLLNADK